ncbi:hypothetical protein [Hymenobacter yonginensis]|uniref:Uncharacterized protein n=1 Tax=Hymenobacter yonginensis TaxID=748197 RepID=A0ABY7PJ33_9BACT|nr:hypothetical protein [Hymenobacter yonginensis]WBO83313.1 hypothetical protein O9Z63_13085 [Hymenobacter yonginensis]
MKKRKSALKYFIRLIKLGELVRRREGFHKEYAGKASVNSDVKYYEDTETVEYEYMNHDFQFIQVVENFGQIIYSEVAQKLKKCQVVIYDGLTSDSLVERQAFARQVTKDVDSLIGIVAGQHIYTKYPCVSTALAEIKKFVTAHSPLQPNDLVDVPDLVDSTIVSCHYKYVGVGTNKEDKALTRHYLTELFHKLRDELRLIALDTSVEDFREIFSGKAVLKPVTWIGTNKQLRHVFMSIEPKLMPLANDRVGKWETVAACFVHRNGDSFTAKQLQSTGLTRKNAAKMSENEDLGSVLR